MAFRTLAALCALALPGASFAAGALVNVIPTPKQIVFARTAPIAVQNGSAAIVVGKRASEPELFAARTLQRTVKRDFGVQWPILRDDEPVAAYKLLVALGQYGGNALFDDGTKPAEGFDGYTVQIARGPNRTLASVVGANPRSVIYGQDILSQLLTRVNGKLCLREASVRDWSSIQWRGKPQTNVDIHLEPGMVELYALARLNFTDLRNGIYAFEPEDALPAEKIAKSLKLAHSCGMVVYGVVNCGIEKIRHDAAIEQFNRFIALGVDGLWISFDDKGPGEAPEELVRRVIELGRARGITGYMIGITPPKGSYQTISAEFNRRIVGIPGMESASWFFTCPPSLENAEIARSIGLKSPWNWWHNWPRGPGGSQTAASSGAYGILLGSGGRREGKHPYLAVPRLREGWHEPSYASLSDAGKVLGGAMEWGGRDWKPEYTYPVLGWWAWSPENHDWAGVRNRIYRLVFGAGCESAAYDFDDTYRKLVTYFRFSGNGNGVDPRFPPILAHQRDRAAARKLIARLEALLARLRAAGRGVGIVDARRLEDFWLDPMRAEVVTAKVAIDLAYPEYWWDAHQRAVLDAIYSGDTQKANTLIKAAAPRVIAEATKIKERLAEARHGADYAKQWTARAKLDAKGWQNVLGQRKVTFNALMDDFEYRKTGDFASTMLKNLNSSPKDLRVVATVMPSDRIQFSGAWTAGERTAGDQRFFAFACPLKVWMHVGEYCETEVVVPVSNVTGWRGVRFFLNTWTNDNIALQPQLGRWLGRHFISLKCGDTTLWESDIALPRGGGEWVTVGLPFVPEGQKGIKVRLRVESRLESFNGAAAAFVGPMQVLFAER